MTTPDRLCARRPRAARWRYGAALAPALGLALAAGHGSTASAQLLPQMGAPVELGDLRTAFQRAYGPGGVGAPVGDRNWIFTPAIDLDVTATDNVRGLGLAHL